MTDDTDQSLLDEHGRFAKGNPSPAGFKQNPQNRNPGGWKKSDTPRFKLEQMMKLTEKELVAINNDEEAPYFERKLAKAINRGDWKTIREMIDQVYGQPSATHQITGKDGKDFMGGLADLIAGAEKVLEDNGESTN